MLVRHIVSVNGADVATARPDTTIADAAKVLRDRNIGALVITTDDGGLVSCPSGTWCAACRTTAPACSP